MAHSKPSVTIRKADDGSFVVEGSVPAAPGEYGSCGPMYDSVTNTAPDIDKALSKAAKILRKRSVNGKEV